MGAKTQHKGAGPGGGEDGVASSSCVRASGCQRDPAGQFNGGAPTGKMRGLRSYFVKRHTPLIYHHFDLLFSLLFWPGEAHGLYGPWGRKELDTTEGLSLSLHF